MVKAHAEKCEMEGRKKGRKGGMEEKGKIWEGKKGGFRNLGSIFVKQQEL